MAMGYLVGDKQDRGQGKVRSVSISVVNGKNNRFVVRMNMQPIHWLQRLLCIELLLWVQYSVGENHMWRNNYKVITTMIDIHTGYLRGNPATGRAGITEESGCQHLHLGGPPPACHRPVSAPASHLSPHSLASSVFCISLIPSSNSTFLLP